MSCTVSRYILLLVKMSTLSFTCVDMLTLGNIFLDILIAGDIQNVCPHLGQLLLLHCLLYFDSNVQFFLNQQFSDDLLLHLLVTADN